MTKKSLCILAFIIALVLVPISAIADLIVTFIDVGQGDAALVRVDGETMLIDTGTEKSSASMIRYFDSTLMYEQYIKRINVLVGTHPHEDHIGGMDAILSKYDVDNIWMPKAQAETQTFEDLLLTIQQKGLKITSPAPGTIYNLGNAKITVLAPNSQSYEDQNNYSIVLRIDYGEISILFAGDAEALSESEMLQSGANVDVDVLKVGHHGSNTATSQEFLDAVSPESVIISCGKDNKYGHPHEETLEKLNAIGASIYRTDVNRTITLTSNGKSYEIEGASPVCRVKSSSVIVRESSSTKAKKITTLKRGAIVNVLMAIQYNEDRWYMVDYGGGNGYIHGNVITEITQEEAAFALAGIPTRKPDYDSAEQEYIGNKNTKKFHMPYCRSLPAEKNQVIFASREEAIKKGYVPCKICDP